MLTDSRKVLPSSKSLYFAIRGVRNNGHDFIKNVYEQGVRQFVVEQAVDVSAYPEANIIQVESAVAVLQAVAIHHRKSFSLPVIGITGSNGKTIVKEWLFQLLSPDYNCVKNPGSYNSQIGVPLSVWQISKHHELGIFEAGISQPGEMEKLEAIIQPTIGLITNIGSAHDEGFSTQTEKVEEKIKLFCNADTIIYCSDYEEIEAVLAKKTKPDQMLIGWGQKTTSKTLLKFINDNEVAFSGHFGPHQFRLPFTNLASKENVLHCIVVLLHLGYTRDQIQLKIDSLHSIPMRLELKQGINQCQIIDDTYNNDLAGLRISLDFLESQNKSKKTVILSDVLQSGQTLDELSHDIVQLLVEKKIDKFIGVGFGFHSHQKFFEGATIEKKFFLTTDDFLSQTDFSEFNNEAILVKGARIFQFEKIVLRLQKKIHGTVMSINLDAMVHNLNFFRSLLKPEVKLMVMVKAFAYGSGSAEIASLLQYHRVDYLGVAYADEGVDLRANRIKTPVMVMNPSADSFSALLEYNLEPEVYSLGLLADLLQFLDGRKCKAHLKIDTGMHRLGLDMKDLQTAGVLLSENPNLTIASVFTHLAGADEAQHDSFTQDQANLFSEAVASLERKLGYRPLRHILNSSGILRFPQFQENMVRLGIGLYGIDPSGKLQENLRPVATLKTIISQIKTIDRGETIGYSRKGRAERELRTATIAIGYADGFSRSFGQCKGVVLIRGVRAPVIGNVCMDMTMVDITEVPEAREGDEVIIFGPGLPIQEVAASIDTIPYEILTNTSERVKRVFYAESI